MTYESSEVALVASVPPYKMDAESYVCFVTAEILT